MPEAFDEGMLVGILVGEGHFGGDGRQPHVTLRMHERHAPLFRWIERAVPGGKLYGPYDHGGRRYYQWMARGPFLRDVLVPILDRRLRSDLDTYAYQRFQAMKEQYGRQLGLPSPSPTGRSDESAEALDRPEPTAGTPGPSDPEGPKDPTARIFAVLRNPHPD